VIVLTGQRVCIFFCEIDYIIGAVRFLNGIHCS